MPGGLPLLRNMFGIILPVLLLTFMVTAIRTETLAQTKTGYASVNGLKMYYEIHSSGKPGIPLVLIHGGGSTIETTFGTVLPLFAKNRKVIAVELQSHGRTEDIERDLSFEQDADDVAALIKQLNINKADIFGFSNGGSTTLQIGIRHPYLVNKLVVASAIFKKDGMFPGFWDFMKNASLNNMPEQLKEAYLKVAPNPDNLIKMHDRDAKRMQEFKDWPENQIRSIKAPTLVISSDKDVVRPEHTLEIYRLLPHGRLTILPGAHGEFIGEIMSIKKDNKLPELTVALIEEFLNEEEN